MSTERINEYIERGWHDKNWYADTENLFIELFGRTELVTVANLFAATSINSSLKSNIRLFRRAYHETKNNLPHEKYLPNIKKQLDQLRSGGELTGNKIRAFARAMSGGTQAVVVDIWLLRAFEMDRKYYREGSKTFRSGGATDKQFAMIEEWVRNYSYELNLQPRELSAIIWSGTRIAHTGDKNTRYHEILRHQLYNMYEQ